MPTTTQPTPTLHRGPAESGPPRLAGLPDVRRVEPLPAQVSEVERYDTDDHRLAAAGVVLAVHRDADDARWTLDLPDGDQLRLPLGQSPAPVPAQFDELVRGITRDRALRPSGRARTTRTTIRLHGDAGLLLEIAHAHVTVATMGRTADVDSWTEAEVRPLTASTGLLAAVARRLADGGLRPASSATAGELDRLLRPAPIRRARAGKKGSAGAALADALAAQVDRLAAEDLRVRRDEPDAVHQMRVASRRLRSLLQAYRPLLDRRRTDPLVDGLRALGQVLAPARDAEVLRERITAGLADLAPELRLGPVQALLTRHLSRPEAEARAAVLTELDGARYAALRGALDDLVAHPPLTGRAARRARRELPRHVTRTARRLERAVAAGTDAESLHAARKAGKRLRYAMEAAGVRRSGLKAFQRALGEHQDSVHARTALRELGAAASAAGENGFAFGVLYGREAARAERIEQDLPALWKATR